MFQKVEKLSEAANRNVRDALIEDLGSGDLSAEILTKKKVFAKLVCKSDEAVLAGQLWFEQCFKFLDKSIEITWLRKDGDLIKKNDTVCRIEGYNLPILSGERSAINFLQVLSSVSTRTKKYVSLLEDLDLTSCAVLDTRKTIPGLRLAQKYAVRVGGGKNQRFGLWDSILIKENHIISVGGLKRLLGRNLSNKLDDHVNLNVQIEVENLDEFEYVKTVGIKNILLDNFSIDDLNKAVKANDKNLILEASGEIGLSNFKDIALTGVSRISIGDLTKNIDSIDFSLRFSY
jgi:nicotinate-nucleotide pyrophosphorylase (carboxylating)